MEARDGTKRFCEQMSNEELGGSSRSNCAAPGEMSLREQCLTFLIRWNRGFSQMSARLWLATWRLPVAWTVIVLIVATPLSILATNAIVASLSGGTLDAAGLIAAIAIPVLLGGPATFFMATKQQTLTTANRRLERLASTDELTRILNRRAFTNLVDIYLAGGPSMQAVPEGAFLVIDADHFKHINDRHGHDMGDEALQKIARQIKANVRAEDIVGRIGGEEFGVLLVGASFDVAEAVAERIRQAISVIDFTPNGVEHKLSISVGGAAFGGPLAFSDLYRVADQRLYDAKQAGRNCVAFATILGEHAARAA
jgi:diguanylate cyclase